MKSTKLAIDIDYGWVTLNTKCFLIYLQICTLYKVVLSAMARLLATIFIVIIFASMLLEYVCSADRSIMWRRRRRRRAVVAPSGWVGRI